MRLIRENAGAAVKAAKAPVVNTGTLAIRTATAVWDPPSQADTVEVTTTLAVPGAVVGDAVAVGFSVPVPAGVLIVAAVTAADVVTVTMLNESGAVKDLASGTLRVQVFQQTS